MSVMSIGRGGVGDLVVFGIGPAVGDGLSASPDFVL